MTTTQELTAIHKYRKLLHKQFRHKQSGEQYQLLMFTLDWATGELYAVLCLTAITQFKYTLPAETLFRQFEPTDGDLVPIIAA